MPGWKLIDVACVKKLLYLLLANYVSYCFKVCGPDDVSLTPYGQKQNLPKIALNSSVQFRSLLTKTGTSYGGLECVDGSFTKLGLLTQLLSCPCI